MKGALFLIIPAALAVAAVASAQTLKDEQHALIAAKRQSQAAQERSAALAREAKAARVDAERARRQAAALAASIQAAEADIQAAQARIAIVARMQRAQTVRLAERKEPIAPLTAALPMLSRRPPVTANVGRATWRERW